MIRSLNANTSWRHAASVACAAVACAALASAAEPVKVGVLQSLTGTMAIS